jgi:hypothetical protein
MDNAKRRDTHNRLGLSRELEVSRDVFDADPSRGGSRGYPCGIELKHWITPTFMVSLLLQLTLHHARG